MQDKWLYLIYSKLGGTAEVEAFVPLRTEAFFVFKERGEHND